MGEGTHFKPGERSVALLAPVLRGRPAGNVLEELCEIVGIGISDAASDLINGELGVGEHDFRKVKSQVQEIVVTGH